MRNENILLEFTMSLIKILNNNGPKLEPSGVPVLNSNNSEVICSYGTIIMWKTVNQTAFNKSKGNL